MNQVYSIARYIIVDFCQSFNDVCDAWAGQSSMHIAKDIIVDFSHILQYIAINISAFIEPNSIASF